MEPRRKPLNTLGKSERLKHRKPIESLFQNGLSVKTTSFVLLFQKSDIPNEHHVKMMFIVSKKNYGLAHDRNQIKRWMRESYRTLKNPIVELAKEKDQHWNAGIMYTGKKMPNHDYVRSKISELLDLWGKQLEEQE
jgi:ribonuclease P protein component